MTPFMLSLLIMAGMNTIDMFSGFFSDRETAKAYETEKTRTETERNAKLDLMDTEYEEAKKQALKNADRSDAQSTMNENAVNFETGAAFDQLSLQQLADTYSFNNAAIQNSAQEGNALASMATSGTRTSSVNTALDLQSAQNEAQLQLAEDQTRAAEEQSLFNILNAYGQNAFQIQNNRTDANDLRHSYDESNEAEFNEKLAEYMELNPSVDEETARANVEKLYKIKLTEGGYNYKMYKKNRELQETAYNNKIEDYEKAIKDYSGWRSALRNTGKLFGVKNAGTANTLANYVDQFDLSDLKTQTNFSFDKVSVVNDSTATKLALPSGTTYKKTPKITNSLWDLTYVPNPANTITQQWEKEYGSLFNW